LNGQKNHITLLFLSSILLVEFMSKDPILIVIIDIGFGTVNYGNQNKTSRNKEK